MFRSFNHAVVLLVLIRRSTIKFVLVTITIFSGNPRTLGPRNLGMIRTRMAGPLAVAHLVGPSIWHCVTMGCLIFRVAVGSKSKSFTTAVF